MNNHPFFIALFGILLNHINKHGKCLDEAICQELAQFIHDSKVRGYGCVLFDFIEEHGVAEDLSYMGRDEFGEKQYHSHNPDTNWSRMIGIALGKLGHYSQGEEAVASFIDVNEFGVVAV